MAYIQYMPLLLNCMFSSLRTDVDSYFNHFLAADSILLSFNILPMKVEVIKKNSPGIQRSWFLDLVQSQEHLGTQHWPRSVTLSSPHISKARAHQGKAGGMVAAKPLLSPNSSLWLLSHPALWPCLTSVFHSTLYLAFLSPRLGQLGKSFGPELGTISEEFPSVNCLTLYWVRVGGFDSCRERCFVLG